MTTGWLGKPNGDIKPYLGYIINQDPEVTQITRHNMNLLQALSNTGGIAVVLAYILRYVTIKLNKKMFQIDLSNNMYSSNNYEEEKDRFEKKSPIDIETNAIS